MTENKKDQKIKKLYETKILIISKFRTMKRCFKRRRANLIIDFTIQLKCTFQINLIKIASKLKKRFVIATTTGFTKKEL